MFVKNRAYPKITLLLAVLLRRLANYHPMRARIEAEKARREAGYKGEKELDRALKKLPYQKFHILNDIRLQIGDEFFQIDSLILTPYLAIILETKYMIGELNFEKGTDQFTRKNNDSSKDRFQNPILQAIDQGFNLNKWLDAHDLPHLPLEYLFVNSHPKTLVTFEPGNEEVLEYICNCENVRHKINNLANKYNEEKISQEELQKIEKTILKEHTPAKVDILRMFQISPIDILNGVQCPNCKHLPMTYKWGKWECAKCKVSSKDAHIHSLNDYFLLIKPSITNKELRHFLQISSPDVATKILHSLNFSSSGTFRNRIYYPKTEKPPQPALAKNLTSERVPAPSL